MARKGYKCITISEDQFNQLKKDAEAHNTTIPRYLKLLISKETS